MTQIALEGHGELLSGGMERAADPVTGAAAGGMYAPQDMGEKTTADDFAALEERIQRTVKLVREERAGRKAAEARCAALEAELAQLSPRQQQLEGEMELLQREREQVRQRVEQLLGQLDAL